MKEKILSIGFVIIVFTFSIFSIILKDKDISLVERRKLANKNMLKENFNDNLDKYLTDQFPLRDNLLTLNNALNRYFLNNKEYNDVYIKDKFLIQKNYPLDYKSLNNFISKLNLINDKYLKNNKSYYIIIPDKAYYLSDKKYLTMDYEYIYDTLNKKMHIRDINIRDLIVLNDYYKTDIHLKQSSYFKLIASLSKYYNFDIKDINYEERNFDNFKGALFYKVPFSKKEKLTYFTNELLENVIVKHLEYEDNYIYKKDSLNSSDAYNVFLSGPSSLIEIENTQAYNDKELVIFRDSFGSSLAPLLVPYYKKITLIDLRYINMELVSNYVDFTNQDVLFLYSTLIVNNSYILKVN